MVAACHQLPGCVAYVGLSYARQATGLGEAQLQNRAGNYELPSDASIPAAVLPFVSSTPPNETISMIDGPAAQGYPIVNYEYAVVSTRQPTAARARDLRAFLHWVITAGQSDPVPGRLRVRAAAAVHPGIPAPARLAGGAVQRADCGDSLAMATVMTRRPRPPQARRPGCGRC